MGLRSVNGSSCASLLFLLVVCTTVDKASADVQMMPGEIRQALLLGDNKPAVVWLKSSVAAGNSNAAYELGKLYRLGKGVPKSRAKALELFELAAAADHEEAVEMIGQLKLNGYMTSGRQEMLHGSSEILAARDWFAWISAGKPPPSDGASVGVIENYEIKNAVGTPLLVHAVQHKQLAWVNHLLAKNVNLAASDARGNGALHCAVQSKKPSLLKALLVAGAPTKLKNAEGASALHLATALGNQLAVKQLLEAGASMHAKNNAGWSAIMIAERSGKSGLLSLFGLRAASSTGRKAATRPVSSESLLHLVRQGKLLEVKRLLNAGIPVDSKSPGGESALTLAVSRGHQDVVVVLLAYGADVNLANGRGATPLHLAAQNSDSATIKLLLKAKANMELKNAAQDTPLLVAVKRQCGGCVALFIDAHADLEAIDKNGMAPLLRAAMAGQKSIVEALLTAGANPYVVDNSDRTSLWWSVKNHHLDVAGVLLDHSTEGGAPKQADVDGVTPLHLAVQDGDVDLVRRLARLGNLNASTETGSSPLLLAAFAGKKLVVELLLTLGAEIDKANSLGDTPLLAAIQERHHNIALQLVKAGASLNHHNLAGLSAKEMIKTIDDTRWSAVLDAEQGVLLAIFKSLSE